MARFIVEVDFYHVGLRCVVIMGERGHRCGYVGIPKEHPLYGVGYMLKSELLKLSPEQYFNVHGGITYSRGGDYPVKNTEGLWWFGYDCAHFGDAPDLNFMEEEKHCLISFDGVVRSLHYCISECKKLAEQLSEFMVTEIVV